MSDAFDHFLSDEPVTSIKIHLYELVLDVGQGDVYIFDKLDRTGGKKELERDLGLLM